MKCGIKFKNIKGTSEIKEYIERRISFAFARIKHEVEGATVTVSDVNGPKGGVDIQCQIVLRSAGLKPVVIAEKNEHIRQAIDKCLSRASQCFHNKIKRKQVRAKKTRAIPLFSATSNDTIVLRGDALGAT